MPGRTSKVSEVSVLSACGGVFPLLLPPFGVGVGTPQRFRTVWVALCLLFFLCESGS